MSGLPETEEAFFAAQILSLHQPGTDPSGDGNRQQLFRGGIIGRMRRRASILRKTMDAKFVQDRSDILQSASFDRAWYLDRYPDVGAFSLDAVDHYLTFGTEEGRDPNVFFSTRWYLTAYPDVRAARINPLAHYVRVGWREARDPSAGFSTARYLREYPFLAELGVNPVAHALLLARLFGAELDALQDRQFPGAGVNDLATHAEVAEPPPSLEPLVAFAYDPQPGSQYELLYSPKISILLPVYNTPTRFLKEAIQSVLAQSYANWELCIVDDGSTLQDFQEILRDAAALDCRIKLAFNAENAGIAATSQSALEMAEGEYIAFIDHDDILAHSALEDVVRTIRNEPDVDYIYTDHAMINSCGQISSFALKPSWSPEFFLSTNYIVHFKVMRRSLVQKVGGFERETSIVQDIGLTCRMIEGGARIRHLPKILYYWREHRHSVASGTSGKPEIENLAIKAYDDYLSRQGIPARVVWPSYFRALRCGVYKLEFKPSTHRIAIVALDFDGLAAPQELEALMNRTAWFEQVPIYIVRKGWPSRFRVSRNVERCTVRDSAGLSSFVDSLDADALVFVGPRPVAISKDWLSDLVGYLDVSPEIGAVGGKVLDTSLKVMSGAFFFAEKPRILLGGLPDVANGYWFNGRAASNVEAVSARLMATSMANYRLAGGLPLEPLELAGLKYCSALRGQGLRVVFNPWSKIVDKSTPDLTSISHFVPSGGDQYYSRELIKARWDELGEYL